MIYSINEGQQAEEYKARKARKAKENEDYVDARIAHRYPVINAKTGDRHLEENDDDNRRNRDARMFVLSHGIGTRGAKKKYSHEDQESAFDAANRHMRRHPKQYKESCGIFSNVYFI